MLNGAALMISGKKGVDHTLGQLPLPIGTTWEVLLEEAKGMYTRGWFGHEVGCIELHMDQSCFNELSKLGFPVEDFDTFNGSAVYLIPPPAHSELRAHSRYEGVVELD